MTQVHWSASCNHLFFHPDKIIVILTSLKFVGVFLRPILRRVHFTHLFLHLLPSTLFSNHLLKLRRRSLQSRMFQVSKVEHAQPLTNSSGGRWIRAATPGLETEFLMREPLQL